MTEEVNVQAQNENEQVGETTQNEGETESQKTEVKPEEQGKKSEEKTEERPVWTMPVAKAQKEKEKAIQKAKEEAKAEAEAKMEELRKEYEQKLSQATSTKEDKTYLAELEKVAEETGIDKEAAEKLLNVFKKAIPVPDTSKYDQLLKEQEVQSFKSKVSGEIEQKVVPLILKDFPQATTEHIQKVKQQIEELAFSEGFNTYRVEDIYKVKKDDFEYKNGFSAEGSSGKSAEYVDFDSVTDEEEHLMAEKDPTAFKKYLEYKTAKASKYID